MIGATWLDQQLIGGASDIAPASDRGFGIEVRNALRQRADFLIDQGLAERRGQRVILARNLLGTLRARDIEIAAKTITAKTGLTHRPVADGEYVTGTYPSPLALTPRRRNFSHKVFRVMPSASAACVMCPSCRSRISIK